jgi:hypothetical protein
MNDQSTPAGKLKASYHKQASAQCHPSSQLEGFLFIWRTDLLETHHSITAECLFVLDIAYAVCSEYCIVTKPLMQ